jgi:hypothetical protein
MKTALWFYWLAVAIICVAAWLYLQHLGLFLHDVLGAKPLPGVTQLTVSYRNWFLVIPPVFAGAAGWLALRSNQGSTMSIYHAISVLTIAAVVSLLLLATLLALTMHAPITVGRAPSVWQWLLTGTW